MNRKAIGLTLCLLATVVTAARAEEFRDYWEFRYTCGLPGNGYGVTLDGQVGFDGALQMNIPVGYTPAAGTVSLGYFSGAVNGGIQLGYRGDNVNGTATLGLGFGRPEHALWIGHMGTGVAWEAATNAQLQLLPETEGAPSLAVGVLDMFNDRGYDVTKPQEVGALSFYAVATRQTGSPDHPAYWTVGYGTGRFNNRLFGGLSYGVSPRLKVLAEYDGFAPNAGAAFDLRPGHGWDAVLFGGLADLDHVTIGATLTRSSD